ncbi:DUF3426 domain-containing protein [Amphibiibacter pelophylacis]|uniref:DUF3426 domain-containing protein n=1 Tax=Amphibiibacter pelophylacis TaxID=1799477 RepID=A0ACC6NYV1_9BURK
MSSLDTAPLPPSPEAPRAARCPHCQTVWQVQPQQWRAVQGWVRCGHCLQPFDAVQNLIDTESSAPQVATAPAPAAHTPPTRVAGSDRSAWPSLDLDEPADASPADRWLDEAEPVTATVTANIASEPALEPEPPPPDFLSPPRTAAAAAPASGWDRASRVLIPLLGLLLVAQMLLASRHWQAAWWPETRAVWVPLCQALGCQLRPERDLAVWSLDNTQLSLLPAPGASASPSGEPPTVDAQGQMRFRLEIALQRSADAVIAEPGLDLTLIGADGQALSQRVFTAAELGLTRATDRERRQNVRDGSAILRLPQDLGENIRTWQARLVYPHAP